MSKRLKLIFNRQIWIILSGLFCLSFSFNTLADIGAVWVTGKTDTTISVNWTAPSGNYQLSGSTPNYKICHEEVGTWATICGGGTVNYTNSKPYTITGLSPNKSYRIKVKCHCKRKNIWGKWKYPKWRTISVAVATTNSSSIIEKYLTVNNVTSSSLNIEMEHNDMLGLAGFDFVRVCYKRYWHPVLNFKNDCKSYDPNVYWAYSDNILGWYNENTPAHPLYSVVSPIISLKKCTRYRVVAFGKYTGSGLSKEIGDTVTGTTGSCGWFNKFMAVINDHEVEVMAEYVKALEAFYQKPLIDHIAREYDAQLYEIRENILENSREDLKNPLTLLQFIVEEKPEVFAAWQQEEALNIERLNLDIYLSIYFPELNKQLDEEFETQ